ncbi:MAG: GspE/PulE family protein [Eubacteriaceae bacterium]|nr:GspE/PulE family protein [Eubacteriaceae bacterium]
MNEPKKNLRIGDILVGEHIITEAQLKEALAYQKVDRSKRLGAILIESGYVTEDQMLTALAQRLDLKLIHMNDIAVDNAAAGLIPRNIAEKYTVIPIAEKEGHLLTAVNDPLDFYAQEDLRLITGKNIDIVLATREEILKSIDNSYSEIEAKKAANEANIAVEDEASVSMVEELDTENGDAPVVNLINSILIKGYNAGASDIHIEPFEGKTVVRIRVDGMIVPYLNLAAALHQSIIARIKIMSSLDIAERRIPQDGHFRVRIKGTEMNIRTSLIPTVYGEKAVLRFLSINTALDHSGAFGMNEVNYNRMMDILRSPHGIIYMTGPTGSGKTTTLYMILEMLAKKNVNIATIEDPVERNIDGINQTQVNAQAGLTFESGLRSLLRQDPDIIMVGETRDNETADIAVRAAITGHLVLSTLHTNDAVSSYVRLVDMGVEPYMVANSLTGLVAQRLVKKICPNCKEAYQPTQAECDILGTDVKTLYRGKGCNQCNHTGYKGRTAVHEILTIDRALRAMISRNEPVDVVYDYVEKNNKITYLRQSLIDLVIQGVTSIDELLKVTYYVQ